MRHLLDAFLNTKRYRLVNRSCYSDKTVLRGSRTYILSRLVLITPSTNKRLYCKLYKCLFPFCIVVTLMPVDMVRLQWMLSKFCVFKFWMQKCLCFLVLNLLIQFKLSCLRSANSDFNLFAVIVSLAIFPCDIQIVDCTFIQPMLGRQVIADPWFRGRS